MCPDAIYRPEVRLATFDNWSENITQQPKDLAYNDFIHRGKNRVVCVKCMLKVKLGTAETQGKDIMIIHAERNLYCGHLYRRVTGKFLPVEKMTEKQIQKRRKMEVEIKKWARERGLVGCEGGRDCPYG